jgi:hypothetical protein
VRLSERRPKHAAYSGSDVRNLGQPALFLWLALGFGVIAYFVSGESLVRGIVGGLAFAVLISLWLRVRGRLWRR